MSDRGMLWWSGRAAGSELPWREIVIGSAGGALLGRLLCGGARGIFTGGVFGAAAGAAFGLLDRLPAAAPPGPATAPPPEGAPGPPARSGPASPPRGRPGEPAREPPREPRAGPAAAASASSTPDFGSWTRAELYEEAQRLDISGRSGMNKAELLEAVREHHA